MCTVHGRRAETKHLFVGSPGAALTESARSSKAMSCRCLPGWPDPSRPKGRPFRARPPTDPSAVVTYSSYFRARARRRRDRVRRNHACRAPWRLSRTYVHPPSKDGDRNRDGTGSGSGPGNDAAGEIHREDTRDRRVASSPVSSPLLSSPLLPGGALDLIAHVAGRAGVAMHSRLHPTGTSTR